MEIWIRTGRTLFDKPPGLYNVVLHDTGDGTLTAEVGDHPTHQITLEMKEVIPMPKIMTLDIEVPSGSRATPFRTWINKLLEPHKMNAISCVEAQSRVSDWINFEHELIPASLWEYKEVKYKLLDFHQDTFSQYADNWYPTIAYTLADPKGGKPMVFTRTACEWVEKFKRIG